MATRFRLIVLVGAAVLSLITLAPDAAAHALPADASPMPGGNAPEGIRSLDVIFTQPVEARFSKVHLSAEGVAANGTATVRGREVLLEMPQGLAPGTYLVEWTAMSARDGHVTRGAWQFVVGNATVAANETRIDVSGVARPLAVAGGTIAGLAILAGVCVFRLWVLDPRLAEWNDPWLGSFGFIGATVHLAGVAGSGLGAAADAGAPVSDLLVGTDFGRTVLIRFLFAALLLLVLGLEDKLPLSLSRVFLGSVVGVSLLLYATYSPSADRFHPPTAGAIVFALHLAAGLAWLGGLVCLYLFLRTHPDEPATYPAELEWVSRRFGQVATYAIPIVALSGLFLTGAAGSGNPLAWADTFVPRYATALLIKVGLVVLMVVIAATNRVRFVANYLRREGVETRPSFRRNVLFEVAVGAIVLGLSALLSITPATL